MLNLHELEQRWIRYKIKSYLPYIAIILSISIILLSIFIFLQESTATVNKNTILEKLTIPEVKAIVSVTPKKPLVKKKTVVPATSNKELTKISKRERSLHNSTNKLTLSPSLGFMKKMQTDQQPYYKTENSNESNDIQVEVPVVTVTHKDIQNLQHQELKVVKKITITHKNTHNDIAEIISRFKKNNNPALSLFVAKKYYELGDYRQAYNYALITNQINRDIDVSWIIFTKSLVKLGKKEKAMKILKQYINQSHSNQAQILLDEIISGKFK